MGRVWTELDIIGIQLTCLYTYSTSIIFIYPYLYATGNLNFDYNFKNDIKIHRKYYISQKKKTIQHNSYIIMYQKYNNSK